MKRIYRDRLYLLADVPGISGFKRWNERTFWITTGAAAKRDRLLVVREYSIGETGRYELADGHLPGHRPIVDRDEAGAWIFANPFQHIVPA